jgi:hypothetical protein
MLNRFGKVDSKEATLGYLQVGIITAREVARY